MSLGTRLTCELDTSKPGYSWPGYSRNNLAWKCPAGIPWFLNSANFLFQIFNRDWSDATTIFKMSMFYSITTSCHYGLTRTLVGWSDLSLINTDSSIPVFKTLLGKVFPQTLPHGLGLRSRLSHSMVKQGGLILCSYICDDTGNFGQ